MASGFFRLGPVVGFRTNPAEWDVSLFRYGFKFVPVGSNKSRGFTVSGSTGYGIDEGHLVFGLEVSGFTDDCAVKPFNDSNRISAVYPLHEFVGPFRRSLNTR